MAALKAPFHTPLTLSWIVAQQKSMSVFMIFPFRRHFPSTHQCASSNGPRGFDIADVVVNRVVLAYIVHHLLADHSYFYCSIVESGPSAQRARSPTWHWGKHLCNLLRPLHIRVDPLKSRASRFAEGRAKNINFMEYTALARQPSNISHNRAHNVHFESCSQNVAQRRRRNLSSPHRRLLR